MLNIKFRIMNEVKIKKFQSSAGFEILVGQDDSSNDKLTLSIGHANDIWLHVRGSPGSHVVLRCGQTNVQPDKMSIREAAALAAWFSKMRKGGKVTVSYCPLKQVRKPRKAKAGTVNIRQAQSIKVHPALLEELC